MGRMFFIMYEIYFRFIKRKKINYLVFYFKYFFLLIFGICIFEILFLDICKFRLYIYFIYNLEKIGFNFYV